MESYQPTLEKSRRDPPKWIEIPVWRFLKAIPTHTLVSIYLKINPLIYILYWHVHENPKTDGPHTTKWSKHLLLQIPIKSLDTTDHHFSYYKINSPIMQLQIKAFQCCLHLISLELLTVNWVIRKFMCKVSTRDK